MTEREKALRMVKAAPELTAEELEKINALYPAYLFRTRRTREIWTSCCGRHEAVPAEKVTDAIREVLEAPHHPEPKPEPMYACHWGLVSAPVKTYREPELVPCPFCGRLAKVKELGRTGRRDNLAAYRRAVVLRWYRGAMWAMAYDTEKRYGGEWALTGKPEATLYKVYRFTSGKASCAYRNGWGGSWCGVKEMRGRPEKLPLPIGEPFSWCTEYGTGYDVVGAKELEKSPFRWCGFGLFLKESGSAMKFLSLCTLYPRQVEMLMKAGMVEAVKDLVDRKKWNSAAFDWREENPCKAFGLSKPEMKAFMAGKKNLDVLARYKQLRKAGVAGTLAELEGLTGELGSTMLRRVTSKLRRYGLPVARWAGYIRKAQAEAKGRRKQPPEFSTVAEWWNDYVDAAEVLGLDLGNPVVLTPKKLKQKHDKVTAAAAAIAEARRVDADKKQARALLRKLSLRYTYSDGRWLIRPPVGPEEIKAEGKALKHCVGGYADRHMRGVCTILFLRDRKYPRKSLVTIEMAGNKLVQIHGWDDERTKCKENPAREDPRKRYAEILDPWLAWVAAGSKRDKRGRPVPPRQKKEDAA